MDVLPIQRRVEASDIPPERLAGNSHLTEEQKIGEAARLFEAVLLRQILENSQKPVFVSKFTDQSTAAGIYRDLVTNQLADSISKSGAFGLAKTLEQQFQRPAPPASAADHRPAEVPPLKPAVPDAGRPHFTPIPHIDPVPKPAQPVAGTLF